MYGCGKLWKVWIKKKKNIHDPNYFETTPLLGSKSGISDGTFITHSENFLILDQYQFSDYTLMFVEYNRQITFFKFIWRMFAFKSNNKEPEYSLNHENTPFTSCLGKNDEKMHFNLGSSNHDLSYDDFVEWALNVVCVEHEVDKSKIKKF